MSNLSIIRCFFARNEKASSLFYIGVILAYAFSFHAPVFLQDKTISSFDFCYFASSAYKSLKPDSLERPSNALLMDVALVMQPWDLAMQSGEISFPWLWNPASGCGAPMLAAAQSAVFDPLKHLGILLEGDNGFGLSCFFKMSLAGIFMWLYLRNLGLLRISSLFGAVSFMASAFMIVWLQFPIATVALFLPLVLLACEYLLVAKYRSGFILLALSFFLGLLGGHPETTLIIFVASLVYLLGRYFLNTGFWVRFTEKTVWISIAVFAGGVGIGFLLAAIQLVPTVEYILNSTKLPQRLASADVAMSWNSVWRLGWEYNYSELLAYIVPDTWGNPSRISNWWNKENNYNGLAGYAGIGVLWLALVAWGGFRQDNRVRVFCLLQMISLAFVLKLNWFYNVVDQIPILNICANKGFLLVFCVSNAALAALLLDRFQKEKRTFGRLEILWMIAVVACFSGMVISDYNGRFAPDSHEWINRYGQMQLLHFFAFLLPFLLIVVFAYFHAVKKKLLVVGLVALLAVDLFITYDQYNPFLDTDLLYPETKAIHFLQSLPEKDRVLPIGLQTIPNSSVASGLLDPRVYDALIVSSYGMFLDRIGANKTLWYVVNNPNRRFCSLASVRYLWGDASWQPEGSDLSLKYADETSSIYENHNALPHAFLAQQWEVVTDIEQAYLKLEAPEFPWRKKIVVETETGENLPGTQLHDASFFQKGHISEYRPMRVVVDIPQNENDSSGMLVLNDVYYPGWIAYVDGVQTPVHRVNGTFRGVVVPDGAHQVIFEYKPFSFFAGAIISLLSCLGLLSFLIHGGLKQRSKSITA